MKLFHFVRYNIIFLNILFLFININNFFIGTAKEIAIGYARLICARITYVGELGYELHIPTEHALHVYEKVCAIGKDMNLVNAGLKALGSLRMEKAYRDYGNKIY